MSEYDQVVSAFATLQGKALSVMKDRQHKYGTGNINQAGYSGVLVRMGDKLARLKNSGENFSDESLADTLIDLSNYALIALMVVQGSWPKPSKEDRATIIKDQIAVLQKELEAL
jgi:hypothetical protein